MQAESNWTKTRYTFICEDKKDEEFLGKMNKYIDGLEEENKKLKEFKEKREKSMFYFKAQMERAEPKTAREAEDLWRAKEIFEGLYREELSCLEEENKTLKEKQKVLDKENCKLIDENVKLKKRIYQNVHGGPRIDYQEFCKKNGI